MPPYYYMRILSNFLANRISDFDERGPGCVAECMKPSPVSLLLAQVWAVPLSIHLLVKMPGKAAEDRQSAWAPISHVGDQDSILAPGFILVQHWLLWSFEKWTCRWKIFISFLSLSLFAFQINILKEKTDFGTKSMHVKNLLKVHGKCVLWKT